MPSTFSDFFTVHILNEENITKIFFLHSCDKAIKASSWQSWQRDSTVLHSLNASIFYTYLPKTSLDSRKSYASNKGKSHGVPNWQPLEGNRYKKWSQIWKSKTEVWCFYVVKTSGDNLNPILVGWVSNWYLPAIFPLFEAWFSLWIRANISE